MPINLSQKQAELHYIDSMFDVTDNYSLSKNIKKENFKTNDSMYQLVSIAAMKFAVPLLEITHVVDRVDVELENGLLDYKNKSFSIVDVSQLIKASGFTADSDYYLLIEDRKIALSCQQVMTMETIDNDTVCWRTEDSKRKWLTGTVKQDGIAILDLAILQQMHLSD